MIVRNNFQIILECNFNYPPRLLVQLLLLIEVAEIGQRKVKPWLTDKFELAYDLLMRA